MVASVWVASALSADHGRNQLEWTNASASPSLLPRWDLNDIWMVHWTGYITLSKTVEFNTQQLCI